ASAAGHLVKSGLTFKKHENPRSGPHGRRSLWPTARLRPHNDGMTGSLLAARGSARAAARAAARRGARGVPDPAARSQDGEPRDGAPAGSVPHVQDPGAAPLLDVSGLSLS